MSDKSFDVSVVVPCHNAERWVADALKSVAMQTIAPREIIVIEDACTDNSRQAIQASGVDVMLRRVQCRNGAASRNAGIHMARGEWVAFQDADDLWYPDHLERARVLLQGSDDVAYLSWSDIFFDGREDEKIRRPMDWPIHTPTAGLTHLQFLEYYAARPAFTMPACVVKRARLLEIGGLDEQQIRRHDIEMWLRAIAGKTWSFDPIPSTAFRGDSPGSISRQVASAAYFLLRAVEKNKQEYASEGLTRMLQRSARTAVATAITDGTREDRRRAWQRAKPYLSPRDRRIFTAMSRMPFAFSCINRLRRKWIALRRRGDAVTPPTTQRTPV